MWYAIHARDRAGSLEKRVASRSAHIERLNELNDQGRLLVAGPLPAIDCEDPGPAGFLGSLVIGNFPSLTEAREWADADPYFAAGVYEQVDVYPFKRVLPL